MIIAAIIGAIIFYIHTPKGKYNFDYFKYKMPIFEIEHVTAIYWCVWTALYLAISLPTMRWDITWVVWPVAGVLYGALLAFLKIKNRKAEHE